jgi:hypothetical protein
MPARTLEEMLAPVVQTSAPAARQVPDGPAEVPEGPAARQVAVEAVTGPVEVAVLPYAFPKLVPLDTAEWFRIHVDILFNVPPNALDSGEQKIPVYVERMNLTNVHNVFHCQIKMPVQQLMLNVDMFQQDAADRQLSIVRYSPSFKLARYFKLAYLINAKVAFVIRLFLRLALDITCPILLNTDVRILGPILLMCLWHRPVLANPLVFLTYGVAIRT